jgi:hypothetical protein
VASSSAAEESERMYSGISSVPKISSGSRLKLKSKKKMNHEIAVKIERKVREEEITLRWFASLMGGCSLRMVFSPCPPWLWGFFLEKEDERE